MQQRKNSAPPEAMTWPRASFVLAGAVVVDAVRAFFHFFWFFGPAIASLYCIHVVDGLVGRVWGLTSAACIATGGVIGYFGAPVLITFGVVMAMAVGFIGFLVLGLWIILKNARMFKTAASAPLQFSAAFAAGVVPFLGALPIFTFTIWRLYRAQIRTEQAALKKWHRDNDAAILQEKNQQVAMLMQSRAMEQAQIAQQQEEQEATNDEMYRQEQAANDEKYSDEEIPERGRRVA